VRDPAYHRGMATHPFSSTLRRIVLACAGVVSLAAAPLQAATDPALEHAQALLAKGILFDGHNDLPWAIRGWKDAPGDVDAYDIRTRAPEGGQTDIPRLRAGGVGAMFWSVYTPGEAAGGFAKTQLEQIDLARRVIAKYPDTFTLASTAADIRAAKAAGKIGGMLGAEGGHAIEDSLALLRMYYALGVRYMTLTHNNHTSWADSAMASEPGQGGLNEFGEQVIAEMNRLGMLVDLSHAHPDTMRDAIGFSQAPVIFSHSNARALTEIPRNVPDDVIRMLPANGGVLMVSFVAPFASQAAADVAFPAMKEYLVRAQGRPEAERKAIYEEIAAETKAKMPKVTVAAVADHLDYIKMLAGVDYIGIGSDYDGNSNWPEGMEDVSTFPLLIAELVRRGWSDEDILKVMGGNVLRALEQAEQVAKKLQGAGAPAP